MSVTVHIAAAIFISMLSALPKPAPAQEGTPPPDATSALPDGAVLSERIIGLAGLENVGRVAPGVYRGAQPRIDGYESLGKLGIRTVVNLRYWHGEKKLVEGAGMRYIERPISVYSSITRREVEEIVSLMADPALQPVFLHCAVGRDRTGMVVAVYRIKMDGWSNEAAEDEMQAFGFNDVFYHLKEFVRAYSP